jgi:hypothetical protein
LLLLPPQAASSIEPIASMATIINHRRPVWNPPVLIGFDTVSPSVLATGAPDACPTGTPPRRAT